MKAEKPPRVGVEAQPPREPPPLALCPTCSLPAHKPISLGSRPGGSDYLCKTHRHWVVHKGGTEVNEHVPCRTREVTKNGKGQVKGIRPETDRHPGPSHQVTAPTITVTMVPVIKPHASYSVRINSHLHFRTTPCSDYNF